jgi:hypothetical protein
LIHPKLRLNLINSGENIPRDGEDLKNGFVCLNII